MRKIVSVLVALLIGCGLLFAGIGEITSDEVSCGSSTMSPGDTCTEISNGSSTDRSYDEQKSDNQRTGYIMTGIGGVFLLVGLAQVVSAAMRRGRASASH